MRKRTVILAVLLLIFLFTLLMPLLLGAFPYLSPMYVSESLVILSFGISLFMLGKFMTFLERHQE